MSDNTYRESYENFYMGNEDKLLDKYKDMLEPSDAPDHIYEGVLDDDYWDTFTQWLDTLTFEDVPDEWLQYQHELSFEDDDDYDKYRDEV